MKSNNPNKRASSRKDVAPTSKTIETPSVRPASRFRTWINAREEVTRGEVFTEPSLTMPNEAMSVRTIIERFAQGVPVSQHDYSDLGLGEEDFSDFDQMDYFEKVEYIKENKEYINQLQSRVDANNSNPKIPPSADPKPAEGSEATEEASPK